jgi:hypothetical protein
MYRCAEFAVRLRNDLSFQNVIADTNNWLRG